MELSALEEILRFEQVSFAYEDGGADHAALRECSVSIRAGERVAVLGNNGAGKSTFFLLANGVLRPRSGTVYFSGRPVDKRTLGALRRGVGLVFQDPDVQILGGTVEEEISFGPMNLKLAEAEVRRRVDGAVAELGLEELRQRAPQYLSGGEKKQVSIADVLAMEPRVMLLDEPAASLDPVHARRLEETLGQLGQRGMALLVATHDVDFAWRWAQRVLVFCDGRLAADRTPEAVFSDEALLRQCNLTRPTLHWAAQVLGLSPAPRTREAFEAAAGAILPLKGEKFP